ncbi:MAG: VOC family protein [Cyclobacteriaceae bacterium]
MKSILIFLLAFFVSLQLLAEEPQPSGEFQITEIKIIARDIIESAKWYIKHMGFKLKKNKSGEYAIIENRQFRMNIVTAKRTVNFNQLSMPDNRERINGFHEIGFLCSDIDSLMYQYEGRSIKILEQPRLDLKYKVKTVVLADADGNRIRLFQANQEQKSSFHYFRPYYLCITTSDIETGARWYEKDMGFAQLTNNYSERERISFAILTKGTMLLELQELSGRTMEITELLSDQIELTRFDEITFSPPKSEQAINMTDNDGNKLKFVGKTP